MPRSMSGRSASATTADGEPLVLVEANLGEGVVGAPLSKYPRFHTRICRPIGLTEDDRARVCTYAAERIGFDYDVKNIFDLLRYLLPLPVPQRWRRRMMSLGSGHPTRIICSALIAQAFEHVRYPILPKITRVRERSRAPRDSRNPPFVALRAARLRHLALLRAGEADHRARLRLSQAWPGPTCRTPTSCADAAGMRRRAATDMPSTARRRRASPSVAASRQSQLLPLQA